MTKPTVRSVWPQIVLSIAGSLLLLSGLAHVGVWMVQGGIWEGPVSWRKPILFGISTGLTVLSMAWLYPKLQPWRWDRYLCSLFGFAMVAEVALITMQQWRGVASHFNHSTVLNSQIENSMTYLIIFATVVLGEFTRRCFANLNAPSDLKLAIQGGMLLLMVSCLIGFLILVYGNQRASIGEDPSTFGKAGVTKFPHGVAIHAIQLFPLGCWFLHRLGIPKRRRTRVIGFTIASTTTFLIFSLMQTLNGKPRFELDLFGVLFLTLSLGLLAWPAIEMAASTRSKRKQPIEIR